MDELMVLREIQSLPLDKLKELAAREATTGSEQTVVKMARAVLTMREQARELFSELLVDDDTGKALALIQSVKDETGQAETTPVRDETWWQKHEQAGHFE